jgi:sugar (pentulose or hexulose) kinase
VFFLLLLLSSLFEVGFFLGLDFGTSGARACVLGEADEPVYESRTAYADPADPRHWREVLSELIEGLPAEIRAGLSALAIDGTSGTLLATDASFEPVSPALLYNDSRATSEAQEISNPQFGPTSGLAKRVWLARHFPGAAFCFHQADWLAALLTGKGGITDYHNALKSGFDVENLQWPDWVSLLPGGHWQQKVLVPGGVIGPLDPVAAKRLGINPACVVRAGTTDSIAAFIAAGMKEPGEAVTSLGTTLVLKLLSEKRVEEPASGVYSHRFGSLWLAGGASNTGGGVLRQFFSVEELRRFSAAIDPNRPSGLDYYPLPRPGDRFPVNDPRLAPRLEPRPQSDAEFLHGLLEGMARIEAQGYRKLMELGASLLNKVTTAGGGAHNETWRQIRQRLLGVPVLVAKHPEAAYGTARLARRGTAMLPGTP